MFDWLRWVDATFSHLQAATARSAGSPAASSRVADAHSHVRAVLDRCEELRVETGGYFDARAGGALDPSGLVKGWSVDEAAAILEPAAYATSRVNAGGDIRLAAARSPTTAGGSASSTRSSAASVAAVVEGTDLAVATSGAYARGDHVLDPHTRRPPAASSP